MRTILVFSLLLAVDHEPEACREARELAEAIKTTLEMIDIRVKEAKAICRVKGSRKCVRLQEEIAELTQEAKDLNEERHAAEAACAKAREAPADG